jgi:hypothetical protein
LSTQCRYTQGLNSQPVSLHTNGCVTCHNLSFSKMVFSPVTFQTPSLKCVVGCLIKGTISMKKVVLRESLGLRGACQ